ncbi:MAG: hypothetical protein FH759_15000 [Sediminimonas qiaohouensis]|uniref:Uncharacterized protein n=1 Tax=Sediminimonas qiaohouensis TaxID=552061 RepID=A0A7C9L9M1_9RHOB|nr:hypothetical protein [Sediminimonas qiaohouensis]MTJ05974.1 hypothetical protein [Sediminimonas qiaohouensis]
MRLRSFTPTAAALTGAGRTLIARPRYAITGGVVVSLTAIAVVALAVGVTPPPMPPKPMQARASGLPTATMPMSVAPILRTDQGPARAAHPVAFAALQPDTLPGLGRLILAPYRPWHGTRSATLSPHPPARQAPPQMAEAESVAPPKPTAAATTRPQARPQALVARLSDRESGTNNTPDAADTLSASLRPQKRPVKLAARAVARRDSPRAVASAAPAKTAPQQQQQPKPQKVAAVATPSPSTSLRLGKRGDGCARKLARAMPRRGFGANDGSAVMARLTGLEGTRRDQVVMNEVLSGNMPGFLHDLTPVKFNGRMADGTAAQVTICVTPDYLALGSERDFVRVPLGLRAATRIAERFDMLLPTSRMVDAIYRNAQLRLPPRPMDPGPQMTSTTYLLRHNATIEKQRNSAGAPAGTLISGHKKDLVLTNRITKRQGRVAIYGWHRPSGNPIQPLSTVHGAEYADYSHGIRLVSKTAYVNGRAVNLRDMLADPRYASLVSKEGPIAGPHLLMASLAGN